MVLGFLKALRENSIGSRKRVLLPNLNCLRLTRVIYDTFSTISTPVCNSPILEKRHSKVPLMENSHKGGEVNSDHHQYPNLDRTNQDPLALMVQNSVPNTKSGKGGH